MRKCHFSAKKVNDSVMELEHKLENAGLAQKGKLESIILLVQIESEL